MFSKFWSYLTKRGKSGYSIPVTALLYGDEFCPDGVTLDEWHILSDRIKTTFSQGSLAAQAGNHVEASIALLLLSFDIQTLAMLVRNYRQKESVRDDKRTERKHLLR